MGRDMFGRIIKELKSHAPFTIFGALTGIFLMMIFSRLSFKTAHTVFYILHPVHVVLSALVTASMYELHECGRISSRCIKGKCNFWVLFIIGYLGSVGIATLSDSVIPYLGEVLLDLPDRKMHLGFIEKWWLINPLAFIGVLVAYYRPATKVPHAGHVLLSTWASLFHILMARGGAISGFGYVVLMVFLFFAVWLPCCISDIAFPLLFVKKNRNVPIKKKSFME